MAKIHIELDTNNGDTLETVRQALLGSTKIYRASVEVAVDREAPDADKFDPNAYKSREYAAADTLTVTSIGEGATATATMAPGNITAINYVTGEVKTFTKDMEPILSDMDGDRKRGEAKPGGRRRTNAQIEEDARYFAQVEAAKANVAAARDPNVKPVTFKTAEAAVAAMEAGVEPSISTGEERVNPDDAADEDAERPKPQGDPTLEDLRRAYTRYADKFGAPAAIKDVRAILGCGVSAVPADKIADGVAKIDAAIAAADIDAHLAATTAEPAAPATATKQDLLAAIMAYGGKYDGTDKPEAMTLTKEDLPKVFAQVFGAGVTGIGSLPEQTPEAYGKALAAIRDATEKNTFKREVKGK